MASGHEEQPPDRPREGAPAQPPETPEARRRAAAERVRHQYSWVDLQIRQAMERGAFDDLPGYGKPIPDLGSDHDPDWWLKKLVERERIAVLPASLQLRKDDADLDGRLDACATEADVRREVTEFNERVMRARYRPAEGPPLITMPRDVDAEVTAWRERRRRRAARREELRRATSADRTPVRPEESERRRRRTRRTGGRRWWPRRGRPEGPASAAGR